MSQLTKFKNQPTGSGSLKDRFLGSILRPRRTLMAGGIAYVSPSATTDADVMALNVLLEPRKMQPKTTTHADVHSSAFNGTSSPGCTRAKKRLKGMPRSRANA